MNWFYANAGQQAGPVNDEEFNRLIGAGDIQPATLVWHEGMTNWEPLSKVRPATGAPPPAAFIPPLGQAAPPPGQVICNECRKAVPVEETMQFGNATICAACKPIYVQKLREGAAPNYALAQGQFRYGGFWIRFAAKFIDGIVLTIVTLPLSFIFGFGNSFNLGAGGRFNPGDLAALLVQQGIIISLGMIIRMLYTWLLVGKYGATLGKMACGLRVVSPDGQPITYLRAFARFWAEIINGFTCTIGYVIAAFDDQKRGLHDHICSTRVVYK